MDPSTPCKRLWLCESATPVWGAQRQKDPPVFLASSLTELVSSGFSERPCVKCKMPSHRERCSVLTSDLHIHMHDAQPPHRHILHVHAEKKNERNPKMLRVLRPWVLESLDYCLTGVATVMGVGQTGGESAPGPGGC